MTPKRIANSGKEAIGATEASAPKTASASASVNSTGNPSVTAQIRASNTDDLAIPNSAPIKMATSTSRLNSHQTAATAFWIVMSFRI
jgi:hypothetical protein